MAKIVITQPIQPSEVARLREMHDVTEMDSPHGLTEVQLAGACQGATVLLCQLTDQVGALVFEVPGLQLVSTIAAGVDNIDLAAAGRRGVAVTHTPNALTETSADLAMALILAVARGVVDGDASVRAGRVGRWGLLREPLGADVHGTTLGIVGMGGIGGAVAHRARHGFGMSVLYNSRSRHENVEAECGAVPVPFAEVLARSDFVSLHAPLTPETAYLMNAETLGLMRSSAFLINTARGGLVNEVALAAALRAGQLAGAALDVFEHEPHVHPSLLELREKLVLTPHIGSATRTARLAMTRTAVDDVLAFGRGTSPLNLVSWE